MSELAGRYDCDAGKEPLILADIISKLRLSAGMRVLDLGCGCGGLTIEIINAAKNIGLKLDLFDIDPVINKLKSFLNEGQLNSIKLLSGVFPEDSNAIFDQYHYDAILCYSVVQYTSKPKLFIKSAVELLNPLGRLLIGDLPNVNKKGRFLCSSYGREFESKYRGVNSKELPLYSDHIDFFKRSTGQNKAINDKLVTEILHEYRTSGFNTYIMTQPLDLPCSYTREDLLIERL